MPYSSRKQRLKVRTLENPQSYAISVTVTLCGPRSSEQARFRRYFPDEVSEAHAEALREEAGQCPLADSGESRQREQRERMLTAMLHDKRKYLARKRKIGALTQSERTESSGRSAVIIAFVCTLSRGRERSIITDNSAAARSPSSSARSTGSDGMKLNSLSLYPNRYCGSMQMTLCCPPFSVL